MSTSPSWFDQEKFSRLVKKVGPKTVTEPLPSTHAASQPVAATTPEGENRPADNPASTSRISLVSKPPSLLAEHRALPALPRRSAPLPSLKPIFAYSQQTAPAHDETSEAPSGHEEAVTGFETEEESALAETWHKMSLLNEELARAIHERDEALIESAALRDQLRAAKDKAPETAPAEPVANEHKDELQKMTAERDDALLELNLVRDQAAKKQAAAKDLRSATQSQELKLVLAERDEARKEYRSIRQQYEDLKKEQNAPRDPSKTKTGHLRLDIEKLLEDARAQLAERDRQIAELKEAVEKAKSSAPSAEDLDAAKQEIAALKEQFAKAKEEASVAQRGLALSQKALHDTRDALREATEGTSLSRHNFDNLKNECATLSQQNAILQAKNDQLLKDLSATKKLSSRM